MSTTTTAATNAATTTTALNMLRDNVRDHMLAIVDDAPLDPADPVHAQIIDIYSHVNLRYFREQIAATGALQVLQPGDDTCSAVQLDADDIVGMDAMLRNIPEIIYAVLAYEHGNPDVNFNSTADSTADNTGFYPENNHELLLAQCAATIYELYITITEED